MLHKLLLAATVFLVAIHVSIAQAARRPDGITVPSDALFSSQGVLCARISASPVPGVLSGGKFVSHLAAAQFYKQQAKRAKNKRKKKQLRDNASAYRRRHAEELAVCQQTAGGGGGEGGGGGGGGGSGAAAVRFNVSGAVGIALAPVTYTPNNQTGCNLQAILNDGSLAPALASGTAQLQRVLIAPNNKIYAVFYQKTNLETSLPDAAGCLLVEVNPETGIPACIDSEVDYIQWDGAYSSGNTYKNRAIQFDAEGAIYYLGAVWQPSFHTILRRHLNGTTTSLINDNISIDNFIVLSDGTVYFDGTNQTNTARWFRRLSGSNYLQNVLAAMYALPSFLYQFPDGKLYFGLMEWDMSPQLYGVYSLPTSGVAIDPLPWIGDGMSAPALHSCYDLNLYNFQCGQMTHYLHTTPDNKVFALAGEQSRGKLLQYYPDVAVVPVSISRVGVIAGVLTNIVLAGTDDAQRNRLVLYDSSTGQEQDLLGQEDIEIYRMHFLAAQNKLIFDGLRFTDNKYVIGQYDFNTGVISSVPTGDTKLVDFEAFQ